MSVYYNEWDRYAAQWLRNLIGAGHLPPGHVDERSIADVQPHELESYTQCHFFTGIGGWPLALQQAGWPADRPVWTGSPPCQPFSNSGKRGGFDDIRHLWPEFHHLITQRKPPVLFGEQVASASGWLSLVRGDLEALGYAVGAIPIQAACAGADHLRDRYWFVADLDRERWSTPSSQDDTAGTLSHAQGQRRDRGQGSSRTAGGHSAQDHDHAHSSSCAEDRRWGSPRSREHIEQQFSAPILGVGENRYVECADGGWRRIPPSGVRWVAHGIPARVARLRAFGNAIDTRPATQLISSWLEADTLRPG